MSNQVFGSEVQRLFAQYEPTVFKITQTTLASPTLELSLPFTVDTSVGNFDGSFTWGGNGIVVQKAGLYTISYQLKEVTGAGTDNFQMNSAIDIYENDITSTIKYSYAKNGYRVAGFGGVPPFCYISGAVTTYLPIGYTVRIRVKNDVSTEPAIVMGESRIEIMRLL